MPNRSQHQLTEQNVSQALQGGGRRPTHKLSAVHMLVLPNKLVDVPMFHPLGDHRKSEFAYCHSKQR